MQLRRQRFDVLVVLIELVEGFIFYNYNDRYCEVLFFPSNDLEWKLDPPV